MSSSISLSIMFGIFHLILHPVFFRHFGGTPVISFPRTKMPSIFDSKEATGFKGEKQTGFVK